MSPIDFLPPATDADSSNVRLEIGRWPAAIYAVGDVHGCLSELHAIERLIVADGQSFAGDKLIVMLGDYIDRGPDSAGVITHLIGPPPDGFVRLCLRGNHDQAMLEALMGDDDSFWLRYGGLKTLQSYGIDPDDYVAADARTRLALLNGAVPAEHKQFLIALPDALIVQHTVFAHAGIRRGIPINRQTSYDLRWIRGDFLDAAPTDGFLVVHGHTPGSEVVFAPGRIGVDTTAFASGRLSAVRLTPEGPPASFTTTR